MRTHRSPRATRTRAWSADVLNAGLLSRTSASQGLRPKKTLSELGFDVCPNAVVLDVDEAPDILGVILNHTIPEPEGTHTAFLTRGDATPKALPGATRAKRSRITAGIGRSLWDEILVRLRQRGHSDIELESLAKPMFRDRVLARQRLGQGIFRILVADVYQRRCAVTGEKALPVLQAAHIRPVASGGMHRVDNGLLLRSDVHTLFDRGYVTVTPEYRLRVSRRLRDDFDNGEQYYRLSRTSVWVPPDPADRPNQEFLEWHAETMFRG